MTSPRQPALILLPGLGTDASLFAVQRSAFPELIVPDWLPPLRKEALSDYAARMAAAVNPGGPCVLGGVSFGGFVALEMTRHLDARGCVLISSLRSSSELPRWMQRWGRWAWLLPPRTDRWVSLFGTVMLATTGPVLPPRLRQLFVHFRKTRGTMLRWACLAATSWKPSTEWPCPVWHLHGDADPIFSPALMRPDTLIAGGGHLLPLTHPFAVTAFLRKILEQIETTGGEGRPIGNISLDPVHRRGSEFPGIP